MSLRLVIAFPENRRILPLVDGTVKPQNIDLEFIVAPPSEVHFRNLKYDEFDIAEMSLSHLIVARERSDGARWDWSALPVFLSKIFPWVDFYVNTASGIESLEYLRGKKVGLPEYQQTRCLWLRTMLKELAGVSPEEITWYNGRTRELSQGIVTGIDENLPPGVVINWLTGEQTLDTMLDRGEIDAAMTSDRGARKESTVSSGRRVFATFDRYGGAPLKNNPRIRKLFPDRGLQLHAEYYRKTGVMPTNHVAIVQNRVLREHPWVALELYKAFQLAKEVAYERAREASLGYLLEDYNNITLMERKDFAEQAAAFGEDPYPLGIRANRDMLDILFRSSFEQGLTRKLARIEDIFYSSTLDT